MQLLLKQVRIVDPRSSHNNQIKDILIKDGKIEAIRKNISSKVRTIKIDGACLSPGWMDVGTYIGDPGHEHIETLISASSAASRGGYTSLAMLPNTQPTIQSKAEVEYIIRRAEHLITDIYPLGALTLGCVGKEMSDMMDMNSAGAIAFTDGKKPIQDSGVLLRSLEYIKTFHGLLINHPSTKGLASDGLIDEGPVSVSLGLGGLPELAEVLMVKRDIDLLRYADSRLHIMNVSCQSSVELITAAKQEGLKITCSVPVQNLLETVDKTKTFDANYKVLPPLRSEENRKFLLQAVKEGSIDFITSNHRPVNIEGKKLEFAYADFGISSLETAFNMLLKAWGKPKKLDRIVEVLSITPRNTLGLPAIKVERGEDANLTLFHQDLTTIPTASNFKSKSKNNPYFEQSLLGKVLGIINKSRSEFYE